MDGNPPTGSWDAGKDGALHWNGGSWQQALGPVGAIMPLQAWIHNMSIWGRQVAAKTAELEDRIEKLETELSKLRRTAS